MPGKVFVSRLTATATEEKLKEHFGVYGNFTEVIIQKSSDANSPRFYGYITFEDEDEATAAAEALDTTFFDGDTINCKSAPI